MPKISIDSWLNRLNTTTTQAFIANQSIHDHTSESVPALHIGARSQLNMRLPKLVHRSLGTVVVW